MHQINNHDLNALLLCSFRYSLGRKSYITAEIAEIIYNNSPFLLREIKQRIISEIEDSIEHNRLGMDCDKKIWKKVLFELQNYDKCSPDGDGLRTHNPAS